MSRPDMTEILEICLRRLEAGSSIDLVVADYPEQAAELRDLLRIATAAAPTVSETRIPPAAQAKSRARMLARAKEIQTRPGSALFWSGLSFFSKHAGSAAFALAAGLLIIVALISTNSFSGSTLTRSEPATEQVGVSALTSDGMRLEREAGLEIRRAEKVAQMIQVKQTGPVNFGGFLTSASVAAGASAAAGSLSAAGWQAGSIPLALSSAQEAQAQALEGVYVEITGVLQSQGIVQIETLDALLFPHNGTVEQIGPDTWTVSGKTLIIDANTSIQGEPQIGSQVEVQTARLANQTALLAITINVVPDPALEPTMTVTVSPNPTRTATGTITATPTPDITPARTQPPVPTSTVRAPKPEPTAMLRPENDDHEGTDDSKIEDDSKDDHGKETEEAGDDHSND